MLQKAAEIVTTLYVTHVESWEKPSIKHGSLLDKVGSITWPEPTFHRLFGNLLTIYVFLGAARAQNVVIGRL